MDTATALAASKVSSGHMYCNAHIWKAQVQMMLVTCLSSDSEAFKHDTKQLECIVELHSALSNVDATRVASSLSGRRLTRSCYLMMHESYSSLIVTTVGWQ